MSLISGAAAATEADRAKFVSQLARLEASTGAVRTLVSLPAGMQAYGPIVAGGSVAWVETSSVDLRAYGWTIHITDVASGADRIVAADRGVHPDGLSSVLPAIAFDGSTLVFTVLGQGGTEATWELHRLSGSSETTIARLGQVRDQRFTALALDSRSIMWIEAVANPDPHATLGIHDLVTGAVSRARTALSSVYQIALTAERTFFATDFGVMETDRVVSYEPKKFGPEGSTVDQMAISGRYLLYRNFDIGQTVAALDLNSQAHAVLARNATFGPVLGANQVLWIEPSISGTAGRVGMIDAK